MSYENFIYICECKKNHRDFIFWFESVSCSKHNKCYMYDTNNLNIISAIRRRLYHDNYCLSYYDLSLNITLQTFMGNGFYVGEELYKFDRFESNDYVENIFDKIFYNLEFF